MNMGRRGRYHLNYELPQLGFGIKLQVATGHEGHRVDFLLVVFIMTISPLQYVMTPHRRVSLRSRALHCDEQVETTFHTRTQIAKLLFNNIFILSV